MPDKISAPEQQERQRQERLLHLAIRFRVNQVSDSETMRQIIQARAQSLVKADKLDMAQMRNLENIAYSTEKVSDITDYLKQQIGRSDLGQRWRYNNVGEAILTDWLNRGETGQQYLQLQKQVETITTDLLADYPGIIEETELQRQLRLALYRDYIRHLTAHYLYEKVKKEDK